jgi:hypothetical protein
MIKKQSLLKSDILLSKPGEKSRRDEMFIDNMRKIKIKLQGSEIEK